MDINILTTKVKQLKNRGAAGPGEIPNELIKHGTNKFYTIIETMNEKCINGENNPTEWNERKDNTNPQKKIIQILRKLS